MPKKSKDNGLWLVRDKDGWYKQYLLKDAPKFNSAIERWEPGGRFAYVAPEDWESLPERFHLPKGGGPVRLRVEIEND